MKIFFFNSEVLQINVNVWFNIFPVHFLCSQKYLNLPFDEINIFLLSIYRFMSVKNSTIIGSYLYLLDYNFFPVIFLETTIKEKRKRKKKGASVQVTVHGPGRKD